MRDTLLLGNRRLSYLDSAPSSRSRNVVVLIHAFPMNASMWDAQIAAAPAGFRFLAPDLRGFGESGIALEPDRLVPTLHDYARDILALLDHLEVARASVVGLSMGGYTAFALVRLAPDRISSLVLANTKAEADDEAGRKGREEMLALLDRAGIGGVADRMLPRLLGETTRRARPDIVEGTRRIIESNGAEGVRQAIVRMMNRPDSTPLLSSIRCPTLLVASDEDRLTPVAQAQAMQRAIAGAALVTIPSAGHLSNVEHPAAFNETLHRFLATRFGE